MNNAGISPWSTTGGTACDEWERGRLGE